MEITRSGKKDDNSMDNDANFGLHVMIAKYEVYKKFRSHEAAARWFKREIRGVFNKLAKEHPGSIIQILGAGKPPHDGLFYRAANEVLGFQLYQHLTRDNIHSWSYTEEKPALAAVEYYARQWSEEAVTIMMKPIKSRGNAKQKGKTNKNDGPCSSSSVAKVPKNPKIAKKTNLAVHGEDIEDEEEDIGDDEDTEAEDEETSSELNDPDWKKKYKNVDLDESYDLDELSTMLEAAEYNGIAPKIVKNSKDEKRGVKKERGMPKKAIKSERDSSSVNMIKKEKSKVKKEVDLLSNKETAYEIRAGLAFLEEKDKELEDDVIEDESECEDEDSTEECESSDGGPRAENVDSKSPVLQTMKINGKAIIPKIVGKNSSNGMFYSEPSTSNASAEKTPRKHANNDEEFANATKKARLSKDNGLAWNTQSLARNNDEVDEFLNMLNNGNQDFPLSDKEQEKEVCDRMLVSANDEVVQIDDENEEAEIVFVATTEGNRKAEVRNALMELQPTGDEDDIEIIDEEPTKNQR